MHASLFCASGLSFWWVEDQTASGRKQTNWHGYMLSFDRYHTWNNSVAEYLEPSFPWCSEPSSDTCGKKAYKHTHTRSELNHLHQVMTHLSIFSCSWALSSGGSYRTRAPSSKGSWRGLLSPARLIPSARKPVGPESKQKAQLKEQHPPGRKQRLAEGMTGRKSIKGNESLEIGKEETKKGYKWK